LGCDEEVEGAFGFEVVCDSEAKSDGVGAGRGFGLDLDHGFAVGGDDLGNHLPLPFFVKAVSADGERTAATQSVECGALGIDGEASVWVLEEGDGIADVSVAGFVDDVLGAAGFEREGSLAGGGTELAG